MAWCFYISVRYYHIDNYFLRLWRADLVGPEWNKYDIWRDKQKIWLPNYEFDIEGFEIVGVGKNLSGLAWNSDSNMLLATINRPASLIIMHTNGDLYSRHALIDSGDAEGIAYLGNGKAAVLLEGQRTIKIIRVPELFDGPITAERTVQLEMPWSGNDGPEGITYNRVTDTLYITKERSPRKILIVQRFLELKSERVTPIEMPDWIASMPFATDLSSIEFSPLHNTMLLLSDESRMLMEVSNDGRPISTIQLNASLGRLPAPQAEGVAVDAQGTIYLVSEPNLFYRLKKIDRVVSSGNR